MKLRRWNWPLNGLRILPRVLGGKKLPAIVQSWRRVWEQVIPFFAYPKEIRKIIYATNAIESLHMQ
jgi:transposase-like protein